MRGALFAVELREEVQRRKQMLVFAVLGVALLVIEVGVFGFRGHANFLALACASG